MAAQALEGHLGTSLEVDLCARCQAFWFDGRESLQLAPGATLRLFRLVGEQAAHAGAPVGEGLPCPRCGLRLALAHDRQRSTTFRYWRCPQGHGRFQTFYDFLRQKDFIRPLSPAQVEELRRNVQVVNCSNCGAPIDLARGSACAHCGSPLSMLDLRQAGELIARLQGADRPGGPVDPTLPLRLEQARRQVETAFASVPDDGDWLREVASSGLVGAGLGALARWLAKG
jgi:hypothetical protein